MQTNQVKTWKFFIHDLPAWNKKADILPWTTTLIACWHSQFNYVFALLISMLRFKSINFCSNKPKVKFVQKNSKISEHGGQSTQILLPRL